MGNNPLYEESSNVTLNNNTLAVPFYGNPAKSSNPQSQGGRIDPVSLDPLKSQLIRGTMMFSPDKLKELDPSYTGYTHVFVLRTPPVLQCPADDESGQIANFDTDPVTGESGTAIAKRHCQNLQTLFTLGCTSYSGTPDLTLNTSQVQVGWSERAYAAPTYSAYDGTSFTLRCLELRGDPLRLGIEYYISAIADPNVKAALMNGALKNGVLMQPTLSNFTWAFMIVQTDQTQLNIQDISLWQNAICNGIDRSTLDWENGTIDIVPPREVSFSGVYVPNLMRNAEVFKAARHLLHKRLTLYKRYQDMDVSDLGIKEWDDFRVSETTST